MGLGKQSAIDLAKHNPSRLWIAARSSDKANEIIIEIEKSSPRVQLHFLELDLASFDSIKEAAKTFSAACSRLDILMLNAGMMGGPNTTSKEGYELRFGVNHVGHALFLKLLVPVLHRTAAEPIGMEPRIVITSSDGHRYTNGIDFNTIKSTQENLSIVTRYAQSKLANVLYARELANRYPKFTTVSIHPGTVKTELFSASEGGLIYRLVGTLLVPWIAVSAEVGVKNQLWAATAKDVKTGEYYEPIAISGKDSDLSKDVALSKKLWDWTEKELKGHVI